MVNPQGIPKPIEEFRPYLMILARAQQWKGLEKKLDASDVVQETLLKACQKVDQFRGDSIGEQAKWLRKILSNCVAEVARRHGAVKRDYRREQQIHQELDDTSARLAVFPTDDGTTPSEAAIREERKMKISVALENLPEDQRRVVIFAHFMDLSIKAIADELNTTPKVVVGLRRRGLAQLRPLLE